MPFLLYSNILMFSMTWVILGHTFFFSLPYTDNPLVSSFLILVTPFKQRIDIFIEDSQLNLPFFVESNLQSTTPIVIMKFFL